MRLAIHLAQTVGWLRVELATVRIAELELSELRERDVLLVDAAVLRSDRGEAGAALLVLHDGRRNQVSVELRSGSSFATVTERCDQPASDAAAINLVHLLFDHRESPPLELGSTIALCTAPSDPLVVTWRDEVKGWGRFIDLDGQVGVVLEALTRP